jgi:MFS family permease
VHAPTPLPYQKITLLGFILFANNASIWMIFSFLPFMVQYYFPLLSKAELGYYAGILGSAFSSGSLIGNIMWGIVSDRWGRRPALLLGLLGTG